MDVGLKAVDLELKRVCESLILETAKGAVEPISSFMLKVNFVTSLAINQKQPTNFLKKSSIRYQHSGYAMNHDQFKAVIFFQTRHLHLRVKFKESLLVLRNSLRTELM